MSNNKLISNGPANGFPNSFKIKSSRSITGSEISKYFVNQVGIDIEAKGVDRFRRDILQIGLSTPRGKLFELNLRQPEGFTPDQLQNFHKRKGGLADYLSGNISGVPGIDLTQTQRFSRIRDESGKRFFRAVLSDLEAQKYLTRFIGTSSNVIGHNIINFERKKFKAWMGEQNPIKVSEEYWDLIKSNKNARKADLADFKSGKISAEVVRQRDRARQMSVYELMIREAKKGGSTVDTMEIAKALNAIAQERGLIPGTSEIALGANIEFLSSTLLKGSKEYHRGVQDVVLQNKLAPMLVHAVEELKQGRTPRYLKPWIKAWKDPSKLKIQAQTRTIERGIEALYFDKSTELFGGSLRVKSYSEFSHALSRTGEYAPAIKTQGGRLAEYGISELEIFKRSEAGISPYHQDLLNKLTGKRGGILGGPRGISLPKGIGRIAAIGAGIGLGAYVLGRTFKISGRDDDYNSIEGLRHGWFGSSRKYITDFGSGFSLDKVNQFSQLLSRPGEEERINKEIEGAPKAFGEFSPLELMRFRDFQTLEGINQRRKQLREVKLSQYQVLVDDADTLVLNKKGASGLPIYIRMAGIDAPETTHGNNPVQAYRIGQDQPFGEKSIKRLKDILGRGDDLRLFVDPTQKTYGRYLGVIYKSNRNVNLQLVEEGYASSLEFGNQHKDAVDRAAFMAAGTKAEREGLGMWGEDFFQDWRAFSRGAGRDITFNSFTDILRLAKNKYLARGAAEMWEDGVNTGESYRFGSLYQMTNQFSGSDDEYNTITALPHRWFGNQRKQNTDFGSGYQGPNRDLYKDNYVDPTPFNWGTLGALGGTAFGARYLWNKDFSVFGKKIKIDDLSYMGQGVTSSFLGRENAKWKDLAYNAIRRFELGFGGLPKAFSVSTILSPSILKDAQFTVDISSKKEYFGPKKPLDTRFGYGYKKYLEILTGQKLDDYKEVTYKSGKLYGKTFSGKEAILLEEARLFQRIHDPAITKSVSQYSKSYENMFGIAGVGAEHQFLIGGGKTKTQAYLRGLHAYAHETFSKPMRLLDDPIKAFREIFPNVDPKLTAGVEKFTKLFPKLGVGGEKELIAPLHKLFGKHLRTAMPVLLGAPILLGTGNWLAKQAGEAVFGEDSVVGKAGIMGILAESARLAHMTYASVSEITGLTALRKYGEETAPGMVGFQPWLGFTLSGLITGTAAGMAYNVIQEMRAPSGAARYASMIEAKTSRQMMGGLFNKLPTMGKEMTRAVRWGKVGAAVMGAATLPFLLLGLGSEKSVDELNEEYLGRKEVAIKKARWWEFGTTPWEGEKIMYYRPNWYNRIMDDATEKSIYGDEDISPIGKAIRSLIDPYWLEKKTYQERPYPIAGTSGEHLGIFGTLYESTIGRVLKPPAYMHVEEWMGGYKTEKKQYEPSRDLGGLPKEEAMSPYSLKEQLKQQYYMSYEAAGLRGFVFSTIKEALTGDQDLFEETPILQSSADIDSTRRKFWDMNLGGLLGLTEPYRRFVPKRPYSSDYVNPIKNLMPDWMPGEDYFINFKVGDPYSKIAEGEYRLPGKGYEARYKELAGLDPEKYPLIHRYKILADVAPYSKEFRQVRRKLESYEPTEYEKGIFLETEKQLEEKRKRKEFRPEVYDQTVLGRYGAALADIARMNPLEQLTPIAPAHKLLPPTTPLSSYEESIYGKEFKLWQRPIDDFIRPFFTTASNMIGLDSIPEHIREAREIERYFDELKFIKNKRLENMAYARGAVARAKYYRREASQTLIGADAYANEFRLLAALPKREKVYFNQFMEAKPEERERILELVPDNMRDLYIAQWDKAILRDLQENKLEATDQERYNLEREIFNRMAAIRSKRKAEAEAVLSESNPGVPDESWIGWRSDVDLEDIKLKYLIQTGRDYHYYDLWDDRLKSLRRKPYLDDALEQVQPLIERREKPSYQDAYKAAIRMGIREPIITESTEGYSYNLEQERDDEIYNHLRSLEKIV